MLAVNYCPQLFMLILNHFIKPLGKIVVWTTDDGATLSVLTKGTRHVMESAIFSLE